MDLLSPSQIPGFGFRPNEAELVGYYLFHQIKGNHILVDGVIRVINNICSIDPWDLRFQSEIKSNDLVWYFLSPRNGGKQKRKTPSGSWKTTGNPVDVKDQWGHVSGVRGKKFGQKRVLTFQSGNQEESSSNSSEKNISAWVMHELHYTATDLSEDERTSYVICRLEYKGGDENILFGDPSVVDQGNSGYYNIFHGFQISGIFDTPLQDPDQPYFYTLPNESDLYNLPPLPQSDWNTQQQGPVTRYYHSCHRPKKPLTVSFPSSDDSDTDSMIGRDDASSSTDSVGSSKDAPYHTPKVDTPSLSAVEPLHNHEAQEQPKQLEGKEKVITKQKSECERKMAEDSIKKSPSTTAVKQSWIVLEEISQRNSRWVHLKNILIGLLLFISIIVWIILAG